jgi:hypothetical protein
MSEGPPAAALLSSRDFLTGLIFAAVGLAFAWGGAKYGFGQARRMGPGYFPVLTGGALALVGLALVARAVVLWIGAGHAGLRPAGRIYLRPLLALTASVAAFAFS